MNVKSMDSLPQLSCRQPSMGTEERAEGQVMDMTYRVMSIVAYSLLQALFYCNVCKYSGMRKRKARHYTHARFFILNI